VKITFGSYSILNVKYQIGLSIVPMVLLAYFFSGLFANLNVAPFYADKTSKLFIVTAEGFLLNIILNFILIPKFQMNGAALATLLTYSVMFLHVYYISQKIYKINYDWKKITKIIFITIIIFAVYYVLKSLDTNSTLLILISLILIILYISLLSILKIINLSSVKILFKRV